jgi:ankyrin repeat protein
MAQQAVEQLHEACKRGQVATIRQLLDGGVPVDSQDEDGWTPLHTAIIFRKRESVELLLDLGANIEAVASGMTPLLWAICYAESEDLTGLLLDRGASAHAVDEDGSTALNYAAARGLLVLMGRLIDMGLSVDVRANNGRTPLTEENFDLG